jgi:5-methylcytosine-specific restriction endonuclease McrA
MPKAKDFNYFRKLKSPKWRKKREKILQRDKYRCTCCGSNKNLIVHHTFYFENYPDPWLYPDKSLLTLCDSCHREYHEYHENIIRHYKVAKINNDRVLIPCKIKKIKKPHVLSLSEIQETRELRIKKRAV